jgi:sulfide dehydrogenase cytochrome subunit
MNVLGNKTIATLCFSVFFGVGGCISAAYAGLEEDMQPCFDCHGKDGASTEPDMPIIGGMSAAYINDAMLAYRDEDWPCHETTFPAGPRKGEKTDMCKIAQDLSEKDIEKMSEYLAEKPFVRATQEFDPALAAKGEKIQEESCKKCHAEGGSLPDDDSGILAGQWMPYLRQSFKDYSSGDRPMTKKMKPKYNKLEDADKEALIHYFGSFK